MMKKLTFLNPSSENLNLFILAAQKSQYSAPPEEM